MNNAQTQFKAHTNNTEILNSSFGNEIIKILKNIVQRPTSTARELSNELLLVSVGLIQLELWGVTK